MGTVDRAKKSYVPQFAQITVGGVVNAASVNAVLASSGAGGAALVYVKDDGTFWRSVELAGAFTWVPQGGGPPGGYVLPFYYVGAAGSGPGGSSPQFATIAAAVAAWLADGSPRVAIHLACGAYNETVQLENLLQLVGDVDPFNNKNGATITGGIVVAPGSTGSAILENVECNNIGGDAVVVTDAWTLVFLRCRFAGSSGVDVAWTSRGSLVLHGCTLSGEVRLLGDLGSGTLDAFATRFFSELTFGPDCARGDLSDCYTFGRIKNSCTSQRVLLTNHTARLTSGVEAYSIAFNATVVHKDGVIAARATPYAVTGLGTLKYTGVTWGEGDSSPAASVDPGITVQTTGFSDFLQPQIVVVPPPLAVQLLTEYAADLVLLTGGISGTVVMLEAGQALAGHPYVLKNTAAVSHTLVRANAEYFDDPSLTSLVLAPNAAYTLVPVRGVVPFWRLVASLTSSVIYLPFSGQFEGDVVGDPPKPVVRSWADERDLKPFPSADGYPFPDAGVMASLRVAVPSNGLVTATTFRVFVNDLPTSAFVVVGAGFVGQFVWSGAVPFGAGDTVSLQSTNLGGLPLNYLFARAILRCALG